MDGEWDDERVLEGAGRCGYPSNGTYNTLRLDAYSFNNGIQVQGIACGIEYLHDLGVVHADLRGVRMLAVRRNERLELTIHSIGQCSDRS